MFRMTCNVSFSGQLVQSRERRPFGVPPGNFNRQGCLLSLITNALSSVSGRGPIQTFDHAEEMKASARSKEYADGGVSWKDVIAQSIRNGGSRIEMTLELEKQMRTEIIILV